MSIRFADNHDVSDHVLTLPRDAATSSRHSRFGYALGAGLVCAFAVGKAVLADSLDPDFFWHIRVADQLLAQGIGPVVDTFSFMSNRTPWTPFSWLGELLMKWTFDAGGLRGIVAVHALCSALFFYFLARSCGEMCQHLTGSRRHVATIVALVAAALFALPYFSFRPVTFALALLAAMCFTLNRDRRVGDGRASWLVPMTLLLTNLHLYVILWIAYLWARWLGMCLDAWNYLPGPDVQRQIENRLLHSRQEKRPLHGARDLAARFPISRRFPLRRQFLLALACSLAALCTPMLPGCIRNAIWFGSEDPMVKHALVSEILPFHAGAVGKALLAIVLLHLALTFGTLVRNRRASQSHEKGSGPFFAKKGPDPFSFGFEHLFTLAAALVFLMQMGRFSTVYALLAMPLFAAQLPAMREAVLDRGLVRVTLACSFTFLLAQIALGFPRSSTRVDDWIVRHDDNLRYPTRAADYVDANIAPVNGKVINELTWGGYLIWRLGDRYQVFMDGRTLIYPPSFWNDLYLGGDDAKTTILSGQRADAAILPTQNSRLAAPLKRLGWTLAYADDRAMVLLPPARITDADSHPLPN